MVREIKKAAVIGAGVMGSGIAAHMANAGIQVLLLDLPQSGLGQKNKLAEDAIERMKKTDPAPFMSAAAVKRVTAGNTESDLEKLADCDWIVEAIIEKIEYKRDLYTKLEKVIRPGTIVSSNTSTIPMEKLVEGRSADFKKNFFITHFFNPPRYTRLLEIVSAPDSDKESLKTLTEFADIHLGKGVVNCKDSPGFIANRIGTFWIQKAMVEALDRDISVEEADAIFGRPMGIPKTGVFALVDLVGLDLIPLVTQSMRNALPQIDPFNTSYKDIPVIHKLIEDGYTGRKGKGGFYRLNKTADGSKVKESVNLKTGEFAPSQKAKLPILNAAKNNLRLLLSGTDPYSQYAWSVLSEVLRYTADIANDIADNIADIDQAMRLGYNWKYGPFELIDKIGAAWFSDRLKAEGRAVPAILAAVGDGSFYKIENGAIHYFNGSGYTELKRPEGVLVLSDIKLKTKPIAKNASAALWDIGDGVVCLEFISKMNSLDPEIMKMIMKTVDIVKKDYKALVVYNEGSNFSAGANLGLALFAINVALWPLIESIVKGGQDAYMALKYAPFPVVSAPSGMALGGGCEILLHSDAVVAHSESYIGLVEVGVGIVPAWGGCKEMLHRYLTNKRGPAGGMVAVGKLFETIGTARVAKSAFEAKENLFIKEEDPIVMNRDRVLAMAKAHALSLVGGYQAPEPPQYNLPGSAARVSLTMAVKAMVKLGKATEYDEEISKKLAYILTGGEDEASTEEEILALEREAFMTLIRNPKTHARMQSILETGKPLRN
ncbi:3-hydroxyacyl-CoA dehydrogenase/enoyl-CoA hydratase family protein [Candidatus Odyssella thessalonicensis]|uniref:3-hydroxyacyl-CoA dehydrogenase/enoyl-CoA hydratase family protein n=1 Tax=Candidatus Odyssella thessalonicensis TaxID=84647 RepID=UPI000225B1CE|nr:3-hydroxyacyl-CoA dehydrogenase/enoyl-CoA hydratase family protein [Candidatus Odyssella thessalonicensis]